MMTGAKNILYKFLRREKTSLMDPTFALSAERFLHMGLTEEQYDTQQNTEVIQIVAAKGMVFALTRSGICKCFSRATNAIVCRLNLGNEIILCLFYNKNNDSIVAAYANNPESNSIECRSTTIRAIRDGQPDTRIPVLESVPQQPLGSVRFDALERKGVTYTPNDSVYRVFELTNYALLFTLSDDKIADIRMRTPGVMLVIFKPIQCYIRMQILSMEDGTVLKSFTHNILRNKGIPFIELFNDKLMVKQDNHDLVIFDVLKEEIETVSRDVFMTPREYEFLYKTHLFLTKRSASCCIWTASLAELVTSFEDFMDITCLTDDQRLIISYHWLEGDGGSIKISSVVNGKCLAKISSNGPEDKKVAEALEDVTALVDEESNEIYTGNKRGLLHVWSN